MSETIIDIVSRWYSTGHISRNEKAILKAEYLLQLNYTPGCTICAAFWSDVKQYFWYNLKSLNLLPVKTTIRKHIILGSGMLMLPGSSTIYINEGEETEDRKVLTDAGAEEILAEFPSYSSLIGINPVWQAREDVLSEESESASDDTESNEESWKSDESGALAALQAKYDALTKEHEQTKQDLSVTKGMLTKANNKLAKQAETSVATTPPAPVNTLPNAEATNVSTDANPPTIPAAQGTGATGAAGDSSSASTGTSASSSDLASSTQETIDEAKA